MLPFMTQAVTALRMYEEEKLTLEEYKKTMKALNAFYNRAAVKELFEQQL